MDKEKKNEQKRFYTIEEEKFAKKARKLHPRNMRGVKTKIDYQEVLYDDVDLSWDALMILLNGAGHVYNSIMWTLGEIDNDVYEKLKQEMVKRIEEDDLLFTAWINIVLSYEELGDDDDELEEDDDVMSPEQAADKLISKR